MVSIDRTQLFARWKALAARLRLHDADGVFDALMERYTGADRHYHDIHHIASSLVELDGARGQCRNADAVEMAIWFHDCVYDSNRPDNEAQSAQIADESLAQMGAERQLIDEVHELILATRHVTLPEEQDERVVVDIDLAPLGAPAEVFDANGNLIRQEYAHLDDAAYVRGRAEILQRFLDRPRIYSTPVFAGRYERQARSNLKRSIAEAGEGARRI